MSQPERQWRTGEWDRVPCPHCGKANDFRGTEELLFNQWTGMAATKEEMVFDCDECKNRMQVVRCVRTVVISVRKA